MSLSPSAPLPSLMTSLSRAGWGDLAGREWQGVRTTLHALVDRLPHRSGEGVSTAEQVAASTGLSLRWTRRCLQALEDLGLIEWRRGGIAYGKPTPSWFRISKRTLVGLVRAARPMRQAAERAHRTATAARILKTRMWFSKAQSPGYRRRSVHAELSSGLHPLSGEVSTTPPRKDDLFARVECDHGYYEDDRLDSGAPRCAMCRVDALRATAQTERVGA
jgi:hypothetical protein